MNWTLAEEEITCRQIRAQDWRELKRLRLEALEAETQFFTADAEAERARTDAEWEAEAAPDEDHSYFGVFEGGSLAAMAGAVRFSHDAVRLVSSYVPKNKRGRGYAGMMNDAREEWAIGKGFKRAVFTIHLANAPSRRLHESRGGAQTHTEHMRFADGSTAAATWWEKPLNP